MSDGIRTRESWHHKPVPNAIRFQTQRKIDGSNVCGTCHPGLGLASQPIAALAISLVVQAAKPGVVQPTVVQPDDVSGVFFADKSGDFFFAVFKSGFADRLVTVHDRPAADEIVRLNEPDLFSVVHAAGKGIEPSGLSPWHAFQERLPTMDATRLALGITGAYPC